MRWLYVALALYIGMIAALSFWPLVAQWWCRRTCIFCRRWSGKHVVCRRCRAKHAAEVR